MSPPTPRPGWAWLPWTVATLVPLSCALLGTGVMSVAPVTTEGPAEVNRC